MIITKLFFFIATESTSLVVLSWDANDHGLVDYVGVLLRYGGAWSNFCFNAFITFCNALCALATLFIWHVICESFIFYFIKAFEDWIFSFY
jgi:hypothetical protein